MARIARLIVPGVAHHVIQRGNRRQKVFFSEQDKKVYIDCLLRCAKPRGLEFLGYCLMDNHVHLIVIPQNQTSLACGLGESHRLYTRSVNFREGWRGYLWEGRFKSYPLSDAHLYRALRYVELNPVRARIVNKPWDYPWSSARAHIFKTEDPLLENNSLIRYAEDWSSYLISPDDIDDPEIFLKHGKTGRPMGDGEFVRSVENATGRSLSRKGRGRKPKPRMFPETFMVSLN